MGTIMTDQKQYELTIQKTLDGSELWLTRVLFIGTKQACLDTLKAKVKEVHDTFAMLDLPLEIKGLYDTSDDEYRVEQQVFVNHNCDLETHAIFAVSEYKSPVQG